MSSKANKASNESATRRGAIIGGESVATFKLVDTRSEWARFEEFGKRYIRRLVPERGFYNTEIEADFLHPISVAAMGREYFVLSINYADEHCTTSDEMRKAVQHGVNTMETAVHILSRWVANNRVAITFAISDMRGSRDKWMKVARKAHWPKHMRQYWAHKARMKNYALIQLIRIRRNMKEF